MDARAASRAYWRANLKLSALLLAIWFTVSFGFGVLLVEPLNRIDFFGFPFGFWWAQQGSIYVFIVLIFVYAAAMRRLDRKYDLDERDVSPEHEDSPEREDSIEREDSLEREDSRE